jgi:hypothetical protein
MSGNIAGQGNYNNPPIPGDGLTVYNAFPG